MEVSRAHDSGNEVEETNPAVERCAGDQEEDGLTEGAHKGQSKANKEELANLIDSASIEFQC